MKPEIAQTQSWRFKTIVVIKRQQQNHHIKQTNDSKPVLQCVEGSFWLLAAFACGRYCAELLISLLGSLYFVFNFVKAN